MVKNRVFYSFFKCMTSPKRIAKITRVTSKPGAFFMGDGTTVVVWSSVRETVGTGVLVKICVGTLVVNWVITGRGVLVV